MFDYEKQIERQKRVDETFEYIFNVGIGLLIACFFYWWLK
jgi:hypothetical protein